MRSLRVDDDDFLGVSQLKLLIDPPVILPYCLLSIHPTSFHVPHNIVLFSIYDRTRKSLICLVTLLVVTNIPTLVLGARWMAVPSVPG